MKNIIKSEKILHFFFSKMFMIFVVLKIADRNFVEKCVSFLMYKDINRKLVCNFFFVN